MNRAARRLAQASAPQRVDLAGPTFAARVYIHTDEAPEPITRRLLTAAQGARVDLTTAKASFLIEATAKGLWKSVIEREGCGTIVPGYRSVLVEVRTRTDDPFDVWGIRVRDAIWVPGKLRLWALELGQLDPTNADQYWTEYMARTGGGLTS